MSKTKDRVVVDGAYLAREAEVAVRTFFAPLAVLVAAATKTPPSAGAPTRSRKTSGRTGSGKRSRGQTTPETKAATDHARLVAE